MTRTRALAWSLAVAWGSTLADSGGAKVLLTADEALALAFPGCAVERATIYLTERELAAANELAGSELGSAVVHPYLARQGTRTCGTAYFDTHRVRTLAETVMVALDAAGKLVRVEVLSFDEPLDYLPRDSWYERFAGRPLDDRLEPGRDLPPVTGATLTVRATTDAARRALAVHQVLAGRAAGERAKP